MARAVVMRRVPLGALKSSSLVRYLDRYRATFRTVTRLINTIRPPAQRRPGAGYPALVKVAIQEDVKMRNALLRELDYSDEVGRHPEATRTLHRDAEGRWQAWRRGSDRSAKRPVCARNLQDDPA